MEFPTSVDDSSLLEHEPLRTYCAMMLKLDKGGSRSQGKLIVDGFVQAMQEDCRAVAACKTWICLVVGISPTEADNLELLDGGVELYRVFFDYQCRLHGKADGKASEYHTQIEKKGLQALNVNIRRQGAAARHLTSGITRSRRGRLGRTYRTPSRNVENQPRSSTEHTNVQVCHTGNESPSSLADPSSVTAVCSGSLTRPKRNVKKHKSRLRIVSIPETSDEDMTPNNLVKKDSALIPIQGTGTTLAPPTSGKEHGTDDDTFNPDGTECFRDDINPEGGHFDALKPKSLSSRFGASGRSQKIRTRKMNRLVEERVIHSYAELTKPVNLSNAKRPSQSSGFDHRGATSIMAREVSTLISPTRDKDSCPTANVTGRQGNNNTSSVDSAGQPISPSAPPVTGKTQPSTSLTGSLVDVETAECDPQLNPISPYVSYPCLITNEDIQSIPRKLVAEHILAGVDGASTGVNRTQLETQSSEDAANNVPAKPKPLSPCFGASAGWQKIRMRKTKQSAEARVINSYAELIKSPRPCRDSVPAEGSTSVMASGAVMLVNPVRDMVNCPAGRVTSRQEDSDTSAVDDPDHASQCQQSVSPSAPPAIGNNPSSTSPTRGLVNFETAVYVSQSNPISPHVSDTRLVTVEDMQPIPRKLVVKRNSTRVNGVSTGVNRIQFEVQSFEDIDAYAQDAANNTLAASDHFDPAEWAEDKNMDLEDGEIAEVDTCGQDNPTEDEIEVLRVDAAPKPRLPSRPPIWAQSRQEVCESLEQFRSYHSGVYSKKDVVKGYLLGAFSASRDIFHHGGKFIISHGGGKSESLLDSSTGRRLQAAQDQTTSDKSVRALLKNYRDNRPLVLLADDKYVLFPYDLSASGYTYVVLGVYWISHAWAEYQPASDGLTRIVRWKFAFQWCEGQDIPWWMGAQELEKMSRPSHCTSEGMASPERSTEARESGFECKQCLRTSPFVYKQNGMCLHPACTMFWITDGKDPQELEYCEEFLKLLPQAFHNLPRVKPTITSQSPGQLTTPYNRCQGWHCAKCGRLSSRYKWECWECANCQARHDVSRRIRTANEFRHQRLSSDSFLHSRINKNSGILTCLPQPIDLGKGRGFTNRLTFVLPHSRGKIHLVLGTPLSNGEANMIFEQYQRQAFAGELKLRRYPLKTHRARGTLLTNYFSQNSGEPYQYVGGTENTVPFTEAPDCVRRALDMIKERAYLGIELNVPFNEVLSAAYLERQKMSFHSDGEKGLGPIIASLSLGSAALMHFRPHASAECPVQQRQIAMSLILRHGDVLIMEGHDVQIHYEHTVIPSNFRIAATARCINST